MRYNQLCYNIGDKVRTQPLEWYNEKRKDSEMFRLNYGLTPAYPEYYEN